MVLLTALGGWRKCGEVTASLSEGYKFFLELSKTGLEQIRSGPGLSFSLRHKPSYETHQGAHLVAAELVAK